MRKIPKLPKIPTRVVVSTAIVIVFAAIMGAYFFLRDHTVAVMSPRGTIAAQERNLIIFASALALVVVVPVFVMAFTFVWKYRAGAHTKKTKYTPDADSSAIAETVWWLVPLLLIGILSVVTWTSSHSLDPFRKLDNGKKPLTIQVVALQWKWLFIYPEQHVATVNHFVIPKDVPVNFQVTADAPMNSFWIPQLGGQIYAMTGMSTQLHLMATQTGIYDGVSANISGKGFSGMHFTAEATSQKLFDEWAQFGANSPKQLDTREYARLARPSENAPKTTYSLADRGLYDGIVMKYMDMGER